MAYSYYAIELSSSLDFKDIVDFETKYEALVWYKVYLESIPKSNYKIVKDDFELFIHRIEGNILHLLVNKFCYIRVDKNRIIVKKNIRQYKDEIWYYLT